MFGAGGSLNEAQVKHLACKSSYVPAGYLSLTCTHTSVRRLRGSQVAHFKDHGPFHANACCTCEQSS